MRDEEKRVIFWGIVSLFLFLAATVAMVFTPLKLLSPISPTGLFRPIIVSLLLYGITLIIGFLGFKIIYYVLAFVIGVYTIGFFGMIMTILNGSNGNLYLRAAVGLLPILGIIVSIYWYIAAFKLRTVLHLDKYKQQLTQQKNNKKGE